jgi:hypothetical protein
MFSQTTRLFETVLKYSGNRFAYRLEPSSWLQDAHHRIQTFLWCELRKNSGSVTIFENSV